MNQTQTTDVFAESVTKFFNTVRVVGVFTNPEDRVVGVRYEGAGIVAQTTEIENRLDANGPNDRFVLQALRNNQGIETEDAIVISTDAGSNLRVSVLELADAVIAGYRSEQLWKRFQDDVIAKGPTKILDIGGRNRSGSASRNVFPEATYTVVDIVADDGVDVVGDAHTLSQTFPLEAFDYAISVSTFEHLHTPWKAVVELNRIMKTGGQCFILTHQTIGMHDTPYDFWRISDSAWDSLFNDPTGFKIIDRELSYPNYILPMTTRPGQENAENAAGFELSAVIAEKVGPCKVDWIAELGGPDPGDYPLS